MPEYPVVLQRLMRFGLWLVGGIFIVAVVAIALLRIGYPFELEWMEGGSLQTVQRLVDGQCIYAPPSMEYVPFIYTPLYFYVCAAMSSLFGGGFFTLRLVSLLASLGSLTMIFLLVRNRTRDIFWSFAGAGLFAACFEIGGGWFDVGRTDPLALFFLLSSVYLLERRPDRIGHLLAGLVFVLAFLTKQSSLVVLVPILAWILISERGARRWMFPGVTVGGILISIWVLNLVSGGWFNYYVFQLPASHKIAWTIVIQFWRLDILVHLPFGLLALFLLLLPVGSEADRKDRWWLLVVAAAFIGSAYSSRLHTGGWDNVLLPAYAILAVILASTLGRLFQAAGNWNGHGHSGRIVQLMIYAVCFLQYTLLIFDPRDHLPTQADQQAGDELVAWLATADGEVWIPHHGWLAAAAGGRATAHSMAIQDVLRGGNAELAAQLKREMLQDAENHRWSIILLDDPAFEKEIQDWYHAAGSAIADTTVFWPVTGLYTRPEWIYEPKEDSGQ